MGDERYERGVELAKMIVEDGLAPEQLTPAQIQDIAFAALRNVIGRDPNNQDVERLAED